MAAIDEQILRTAKEIIVKFIETGRVSPAGFSEAFHSIFTTVDTTVKGALDGVAGPTDQTDGTEAATAKGRKAKTAKR
jgi:hypothetical protein